MVRILTQDSDPVMTRKPDLPPSVCAIVDACLKRERDERTSNSGLLSKQMDGAMREMKAVRFRALGRRTTDRSVGETQRRASDLVPAEDATAVKARAGLGLGRPAQPWYALDSWKTGMLSDPRSVCHAGAATAIGMK